MKEIALAHGVAAAGTVKAGDIAEFERFAEASASAPPGLAYLTREPLKRKNISNWCAGARSALVCAFRYWAPGLDYAAARETAGDPGEFLKASGRKINQPKLLQMPGAKISRYALCRDYHLTVKEKLAAILEHIKAEAPGTEGMAFCDTSPVMEKEFARLAGIGFRGKNTLIVSRGLGSYFFLGGLALNLDLEPDKPAEDSCGGCGLCERACPTGALSGGRLDAGRCLSYWTTQCRGEIPADLAAKSSGFAYGCDLCQEACPLNAAQGPVTPGLGPEEPPARRFFRGS